MASTAAVSAREGVIWSTINGAASVVVPFLVFTLFARMMSPAELAPVMLGVSLLEFLKTLGPQGVYDVLVKYDENDKAHQGTASALLLGSAVLLMIAFAGLVLVSGYFLKTQLPPLLMLLAVKLLFDYAVMQPQAVQVRRGAMRLLGSRILIASIIAALCAFAIVPFAGAYLGLTVYYVILSFMTFVLTVYRSGAMARPRIDPQAFREMGAESARASGVRMTGLTSIYLDQLLLGAVMPAISVGYYNIGKRIEAAAMTLGSSFSSLLFQPTFAKAEPEERLALMAKGLATITLICVPPVVVLVLFAPIAVPFVFGEQWAPASQVVALLSVSGLLRALTGVGGALYTVTDRNGRLLKLSLAAAVATVAIMLGLAQFGVVWVAAAVALRSLAQLVAIFVFLHETASRLGELFWRNCILPMVACAGAAAGVGWGIIWMIGTATKPAQFAVLAGASVVSVSVGFAMLHRRV